MPGKVRIIEYQIVVFVASDSQRCNAESERSLLALMSEGQVGLLTHYFLNNLTSGWNRNSAR
jgi:hypothetical protein